jgi:hypothetical protein
MGTQHRRCVPFVPSGCPLETRDDGMTHQPSPVHAVQIGEPIDRDHRASSLCWCQPVATYRDLGTMAVVFIHGVRGATPESRATERTGGIGGGGRNR